MEYYRCYTEISLANIVHNFEESRKYVPDDVKMLAVIKADAYGHGDYKVARVLEPYADYFAAATVEEAVRLRRKGIEKPILVLGYTSPFQYQEMIRHQITATIYNEKEAQKLSRIAAEMEMDALVHIAVDTGMTRIGFQITEEAADTICRIAKLPYVDVEGMFSHFSTADMKDKTYTEFQKSQFAKMISMLEERGVNIPIRHLCNSAGVMEFDDSRYEMVRIGITLYGIYPSEEVQKDRLDLRSALEWKCHVIHVKDVEEGVSVSYGATYTTRKVTRIATVSAGYADGYPRALSNQGRVLIRGKSAPIIGRICMDQFMVDVTEIEDVKVEDVVTLIGRDGEEMIPVEEVADPAGRFNYEMLCDICAEDTRVHRVYK
jgi:alanine racemase